MDYEIVIGLEVHTQLSTDSKVFCGCSTAFGAGPNSQTCPVCLGMPGALPVLNKKAFEYSLRTALALNCSIAKEVKFDRKHYFYPDLPKNFQISQYDKPLASGGYLEIPVGEGDTGVKKIRINRVHLEEDAGKLMHKEEINASVVDLNRTGMPLLEIVSEPDINSPEEAYLYLTQLKAILKYLGVSDCNMEEGSLRCDANISLRCAGEEELGTKTELKNMNSFKNVREGLAYEAQRQAELLQNGDRVFQETRLWDPVKKGTFLMRSKEEANDYRYFPEPDLVPFIVDSSEIERIEKNLPELPVARAERFVKEFGVSEYDASVLTASREVADYFERVCSLDDNPKEIANWIMGELFGQMNSRGIDVEQIPIAPEDFVGLLKMVSNGKISIKIAKEVLSIMLDTGKSPVEIVKEKGLAQISDRGELEKIIDEVIAANQASVEDIRKGKTQALFFLVGKTMARTSGKANPKMVNEILREKLV